MIALAGGRLVLPDRVLSGASLVIDGDRIAAIESRIIDRGAGLEVIPIPDLTVVPGFIDVHVHGVDGIDVLEGGDAVGRVAARLPRYGVTAFCPTSVACAPAILDRFLGAVGHATSARAPGSARVLPAHLESNFINPDWKGAQPGECLRTFRGDRSEGDFTGDDIVRVMGQHQSGIGIVTVAPERPGGLDLIRLLRDRGHVVSLGHSGCTFDEALEGIRAGVTHATHLFNRMTPFTHRAPGAVGAILGSREVAAEIICDGYHVHPQVVALALAAKGPDLVMAITDGTAASGLAPGTRTTLGRHAIIVGPRSALLEDGTLAGSVTTMDRVFRMLTREVGVPLEIAARLCATTPADRLGLSRFGRVAVGATADLALLSSSLEIVQTWVGGHPAGEH